MFKQKTAYEMRISGWSTDVCSSAPIAEAVKGNEGACSTPLFCDAPSIRAALRPIYQAQGQVRANWRQGPKYANKAPPQHHPSDRHVPCRAPANFIFGTVVDSQAVANARAAARRSEEHTSELQSLMRISYAAFCLKKKLYLSK